MQRSTCFTSYEDFRESLSAHSRKTSSSFSMQSSVTVQQHNSKFSTNIRPDIMFTEVKFCCSKLQGHSGKREYQDDVCPAYFLLQYDKDLDCLKVTEECLTHMHNKRSNTPEASPIHSSETEERLSPDFEVPSKKVCNQSLSLSPKKENNQADPPSLCKVESSLPLEMQDIGEGHSKPTSATVKESSPDAIEAFSRLDNSIKDFQKGHSDSKSALTIGAENQLEQICFQTCSMSSWLVKFPESLLLHRVPSKHGYILYAFLVETKERVNKIVHFCFVKEDNEKNISKMLGMLKHFNVEWPKVKVIYTDVAFGQIDILKEAFPSAQVLLSVYHTIRLIARKIKKDPKFIVYAHKLMDETIYQTSPAKLKLLAEKLEHRLDSDLYARLCKDWFSNDLLWYMHVKKGIHSCSTYMDSLGTIDETISHCLTKQSSMESAAQEFLKSADCLNSKWLEKQKGNLPVISRNVVKTQPKTTKKKTRPILPARPVPTLASEVSTEQDTVEQANENPKLNNAVFLGPKFVQRPIALANKMLLSLKEYCNDIGFQLCSKEWEVAQRSIHLTHEQRDFTTVHILEESHNVSLQGQSCTCYFNQDYKLPCRHILSMLYAYNKPVEENMVSVRWRKTYVKPILDSRMYGKVMMFSHYTKSKMDTLERIGKIKSLAKEFYNLLIQCDESEMQVRISTLQTITNMWQNDPSGNTSHSAKEKVTELPYRWVKREPVEGENGIGLELCRLDHQPPS